MLQTPQNIILTPEGSPAKITNTPHGVVRTVLELPSTQSAGLGFVVRYTDTHLAFVMSEGVHGISLSQALLNWLWEKYATEENSYQEDDFGNILYDYLQGPARQIANDSQPHSLITGFMDRRRDQGRIVLGWVGTSSLRALNIQRDIIPMDVGLYPGEAWSGASGMIPAEARPHVYRGRINTIDRFYIYTTAFAKLADELPYVGRTTLQRLAEKQADDGPAFLFDIHPRQILLEPGEVALNYRWESPTKVILSWTGSEEGTGYLIEQADTPEFITSVVIAELTDHRQRVYTVAPPVDHDVYYRVVPMNKNVRGIPSTPVIVTPVPLIAPVIERVDWSEHGHIRIQWSLVPQADTYELEGSPSQDFDSAQTSILYRGEALAFEYKNSPQPTGWYFRVRSRNSFFIPDLPSTWSSVKRAPHRLDTPTFKTVSPTVISWTPVTGASFYEIRQRTPVSEQNLGTVTDSKFIPPSNTDAAYEVRAWREAEDDLTVSNWSNQVTVGAVIVDDVDAEVNLTRMRDTDTLPINTISTTQTVIPITRPNWVVWGAIFLAVLFAGLLAGLLAGPQLGIGIDPTATPLKPEDASATAFQATLGQENAIARATLQNDLSRVNLAATEISHQLQNLQTRNANLSAESKAFSGNASTLTAELANVQATGTALDILQGTTVAQLENDIISLQSTHASYSLAATTSYRTSNALQTQMSNLLVTIQALYSPTPTSSFTPSPTNTPSPSFTPSSTFTPSPTATPTDTVTPSFTPSPTPTPTDTPTEIPSPTLAPIFGNAVRKVW